MWAGSRLEPRKDGVLRAGHGGRAAEVGGAGGGMGGVDSPDHLKRTAAAADNVAGSVSNLSGRVMTLRYNLMDDASYQDCLARADWAGADLYIR